MIKKGVFWNEGYYLYLQILFDIGEVLLDDKRWRRSRNTLLALNCGCFLPFPFVFGVAIGSPNGGVLANRIF
jgi:hypothetical protein